MSNTVYYAVLLCTNVVRVQKELSAAVSLLFKPAKKGPSRHREIGPSVPQRELGRLGAVRPGAVARQPGGTEGLVAA